MADAMDIEQERQQLILDAQIEQARRKPAAPSAFLCEECDAQIPEARRLAVPGTARCANCQELHETKSRHYRG
ncbi:MULTISPECIES: TraR/DksA family transcriptional regulator [Serratia]|uniref:TraR/DksA family transcriptional regulator n=1 Tax=Serratia TaxID=613 RepID=UPI000EF22A0A|nr:TraR/DksA family transcriptional regulator [Serratia marcescens]MDP8823472.1 TraR/DksA family transcriptional regulator [Serratia marcescens]MDX7543778.1 TraR/DksA family transcriptional regulator [Serratia marcescens]MDX7565391.1 TraR/DksA family transcriptional regulator [Serratia marcescens]NSM20502.1 TraR/DksA family transcriptional regulator [Serratia marcescens]NSM47761.1 TraR/DksA family transcriptional regulator [Serratia marcescens]